MSINPPRILIAAGGTGGHIFPALHVAAAIKNLNPSVVIEFVGTGRPLEEKLIVGAGYKLTVVPISGLVGRGLVGVIKFIFSFPGAFLKTWQLLSTFKPDLVFGFGGYSSFLPVTISWMRGIPTWIHEAEASPGLANKVLGFYVNRISTAFPSTAFSKSRSLATGHPVRVDLLSVSKMKALSKNPVKILIVGGSQGSRAIDEAMIEIAPKLAQKEVFITHQTRPENEEKVRQAYKNAGVTSQVVSFIKEMPSAYEDCDIIIARSGAGTVAEVAVINRPAIFVPLPSSQGGHQLVNAKILADLGKAIIVTEGESFSSSLWRTLETLTDLTEYKKMEDAPGPNISTNAAETIAKESLKLISK